MTQHQFACLMVKYGWQRLATECRRFRCLSSKKPDDWTFEDWLSLDGLVTRMGGFWSVAPGRKPVELFYLVASAGSPRSGDAVP